MDEAKCHSAILDWVTPNAEEILLRAARISSANPNSKNDALIGYLLEHNHISPFGTVNAAVYVKTTRTIGRQLLRHWSFCFQESSQRYKTTDEEIYVADLRMQDKKNRQNSIPIDETNQEQVELAVKWKEEMTKHARTSLSIYNDMIHANVAKEVARDILPEGCTLTKIYMNGTLRSWISFLQSRCPSYGAVGVQKEAIEVAESIAEILRPHFPATFSYLKKEYYNKELYKHFRSQLLGRIQISAEGITVDGKPVSPTDIKFDVV